MKQINLLLILISVLLFVNAYGQSNVSEPMSFQIENDEEDFLSSDIPIISYNIIGDNDGKLYRHNPFKLQVIVKNTNRKTLKKLMIGLDLPKNISCLDDNKEQLYLGTLKPYEKKIIEYELLANQKVADRIKIQVDLDNRAGHNVTSIDIPLQFSTYVEKSIAKNEEPKEQTSPKEQVPQQKSEEPKKQPEKEVIVQQEATPEYNVDEYIPATGAKTPNSFVVIIANENYKNVASVPYALNDGRIFAKYCHTTLGIPSTNIKLLENATYNDIRLIVAWLQNVCDKYEGEASVIFYYAGHGIPDVSDKSAYLLPVDGDGRYVATGYNLDELYRKLGDMPAQSITVLLDACFSGANRDGKMLASERGVALKTKSGVPQGNMVVFSAAQEDETALPNEEERHGMFTYFILKKLQETKGDVTLQDLSKYVIREVGRRSAVVNKPQTPCITPSVFVGNDWQNWKLK